ncbi:MAG: RIP metalloprotease RseP [Ignavibacteriales bacterium]|nr:RIP metalloprotease RseP [Ignavibacteriales bacterium]MCF8306257.1 RIP metalloprotease RseP [Ignavibacteriales bacterium]MCF8315978.1 RIP metalloprotease RseP [Ignavibacteriales bacterium]MCF8437572.1 RIP metalloprotease RseP [Ignavibacteriales bacterium]
MDYILWFLLTIVVLVFVHEFGHFIAAKMTGMRVDVFSIGFGQRLFGWNKLTGFSWGGLPEDFDGEGNTDYRFCLLPFGGYVKIAGMIDESLDTKFKDSKPVENEFRSKSTPAKLFVILGGVLMNLLLSIFIFTGINYFEGKQVIKSTEIGYVRDGSFAYEAGFRSGDIIEEINGEPVEFWDDIIQKMLIDSHGSTIKAVVQRNGIESELSIKHEDAAEASKESFFLTIGKTKPYVLEVLKDSPAMDAGLKSGDIFIALNEQPVSTSREVTAIISTNKQKPIPAKIQRDKDTLTLSVTPAIEGVIGIGISDFYSGEFEYRTFNLIESFTGSFNNIASYTGLTLTMVKRVIVGDAKLGQTFGGPVKIAQFAADSAGRGITAFLNFIALLSLSLAIINIFPFPVLDGGHFVIILIEGVIRKELPLKLKIAIQNAGMVLLLLLMAIIIYNDIINL